MKLTIDCNYVIVDVALRSESTSDIVRAFKNAMVTCGYVVDDYFYSEDGSSMEDSINKVEDIVHSWKDLYETERDEHDKLKEENQALKADLAVADSTTCSYIDNLRLCATTRDTIREKIDTLEKLLKTNRIGEVSGRFILWHQGVELKESGTLLGLLDEPSKEGTTAHPSMLDEYEELTYEHNDLFFKYKTLKEEHDKLKEQHKCFKKISDKVGVEYSQLKEKIKSESIKTSEWNALVVKLEQANQVLKEDLADAQGSLDAINKVDHNRLDSLIDVDKPIGEVFFKSKETVPQCAKSDCQFVTTFPHWNCSTCLDYNHFVKAKEETKINNYSDYETGFQEGKKRVMAEVEKLEAILKDDTANILKYDGSFVLDGGYRNGYICKSDSLLELGNSYE